MRKIAGAVSAVVLVSAAILTCAKTMFVTQAVGMGVEGSVGAESAAAKIAYRFPANTELFRAFITPSTEGEQAAATPKGDRPPAACASLFSPHLTTDCLAAAGKTASASAPAPAVERRMVVPEPRTAPAAAEPARPHVAAAASAAAPIAAAAPVRAMAAAAPPSCAQTLPTASARVERVLARIKDARSRPGGDACAAYRSDFFEVVQAREVTALCKTGAERERDLGRIDGAVEDINGAIAATCGT
jgi:hypothetical protein